MAIDDSIQGPATDDDQPATVPDPAPKAEPDSSAEPDSPAERKAGTDTPSGWRSLRPLVLRLHFYAGLLIAPLLLTAATSGFLYALSFQAERVVYRHELRVPVGERTVPLSDQLNAARTANPDGKITSVRLPSEDGATTRVLMTSPKVEEGKSLAVFVDPYTAEVRGLLTTYGTSGALPLRTWISELHRHLHLGEPGRIYSELAASWLWVVALGGLLLWVTRRRASQRESQRESKSPSKSSSKRALLLPEAGATGRMADALSARVGRTVGGDRPRTALRHRSDLVEVRGREHHRAQGPARQQHTRCLRHARRRHRRSGWRRP